MTASQQRRWIDEASEEELSLLQSEWLLWARDKQLPPQGDWRIWLLLAGRGFGKTRAGAEWIGLLARRYSQLQIALVGATFDDVRHVMVEGASGILNCAPFWCQPRWLPSQHKLIWPNGSVAPCLDRQCPPSRIIILHHEQDGDELLHQIGKALLALFSQAEILFHRVGESLE